MIALDTSVVIDFLSQDPALAIKAAPHFRAVREQGGVISSVLLTELLYHLSAKQGVQTALEAAVFLEEYPSLSIANVTPEIAILAAELRHKHYSKLRQISYLDCIHLATAITLHAERFVTKDKDFKGIDEMRIEVCS